MRKIFTLLLLLAGFTAMAQQYNNEWIQFNQTYYKFKVAKTGLLRIPKTTLDAIGIGNTPVEFFELWRNGQPVSFYPSVASGALPANGYLEFWGEPNDGKTDKPLYRDPAYQHTDKWSLLTDTATYFLSINTNQSGYRIADVVNNVAGNVLPDEPYFMYTTGNWYKSRINFGFAAVVGEYVYSSSYDKGEVWGTGDIAPSVTQTTALANLHPYTTGPDATFKFGATGNALNPRTISAKVNNTTLKDTLMDYFNDVRATLSFPVSLISAGTASVQFNNNSPIASDRMVVSYFEITYPRVFHFNNLKNFEFTLPAKPAGYFLQITNFSTGSIAPLLYDVTNRERYVGDIATPGIVKFALPGSATERKLILVSAEAANVTAVAELTPKNFVRFTDVSNQGDFVIITHPMLYTGSSGNNPVMDYKAYRESSAGGSHKVVIVHIDELVDQFGYGIKKHPLSVKNFIRFARANYSTTINYVFLMGRGMTYYDYQRNQAKADVEQLNIIPTFGYPASDNMLSSPGATDPVPVTPIGRLSVVRGSEIEDYLQKVIEYENEQKNAANTVAGREWMKNVVHVTGSSDPYLGNVLCSYMGTYREIIQDTLFGGKVSTFCKTSTNPVEQLSSGRLDELFAEGISVLTYFGHSSSTTLEFNIDDPMKYNNQGKYPVFYVNGCNAGNFFTYYPQRLVANETLSEKFTLAKQRGSIAFIASTHYGIVNYLNLYLTNLYTTLGITDYTSNLGRIQRDALQKVMNVTGQYDFYARLHAEEITLHGDPALTLNVQPKPDYVIEEPLIKIDPAFISVAEDNFNLSVKVMNIGKGLPDSVRLEVKRQYPDGSVDTVFYGKMKHIVREGMMSFDVPIVSTRDKGQNRIIVTVDPEDELNEMDETNNTAFKDFFIYQDEVRPVFPYNYSIVNDPQQKLFASTANPFSIQSDYIIEIDTTEAFNSTFKTIKNVTSKGGVIEIEPGIAFTDSTVYYWRISYKPAPGNSDYHWNTASFIYIPGNTEGFNQSHYFQHEKSPLARMVMDTVAREWKFGQNIVNLFARNGMYPTASSNNSDFGVTINNNSEIYSACVGRSLVYNVFDPVSFKAWKNVDANNNNLFRFGSGAANCGGGGRRFNFEFSYMTTANRKLMMDFMDSIPNGHYVLVRSFDYHVSNSNSATWRGDTTLHGANKSLYHKLLEAGFTNIDSLNKPRSWIFLYKKGDYSFTPQFKITDGIYDKIVLTGNCPAPDTLGYITSPVFGPSRQWHEVIWRGASKEEPSNDNVSVNVIGMDANNNETILYTVDKNTQNLDISSVDASLYPYMKLQMRNSDSVTLSPYQLKYWRIHYDPVPEGALAANLFFTSKDSLEVGEKLKFGIAFKNVSKAAFDSIAVKVNVIDKDNITHTIIVPRQKPIISGDTAIVSFEIDTRDFPGDNTLYLDINPDNDQQEQYHFNNFLYRKFYARLDKTNPFLDVTFDRVHILNRDIVSANPHIQIKLKDEAKYLLLNDTALSSVQVKYPDGTTRTYSFDNDTLRFTPATSGDDNTALIDFTPSFLQQINPEGDEYELIVKGKDKSGNRAGNLEYRVSFRVISKPMISNFLNYPNPFSTSTAFVFTITGSEVPQNIKIQILTVTGKIVREITKDELGPLHIGRNITEFKWDGTDQYGQKVGNGVYLYRVVTTLNGRPMEKYKADGDNTDKFFNNGYGKMYLMR